MDLVVHRLENLHKACTGTLDVNGVFECVTLEDVVRDLKEDGSGKINKETAIPAGKYKVIIDFSNRFQKDMLHVLDVPFFSGIRIHSGNSGDHTEGCLLVGMKSDTDDYIHGGSTELPSLFNKIKKALENEEVWIDYRNEFPSEQIQ